MDIILIILLISLLLFFGYAQLRKDIVRTPGEIKMNDEEELELY